MVEDTNIQKLSADVARVHQYILDEIAIIKSWILEYAGQEQYDRLSEIGCLLGKRNYLDQGK